MALVYGESNAYDIHAFLPDLEPGTVEDPLGQNTDSIDDLLRLLVGDPLPTIMRVVPKQALSIKRGTKMVLRVYQKNDVELPYQLVDETGTPVRVAGLDVIFVVALSPGGTPLFERRIGEGVEVVSADQGDIKIILTHANTDLPAQLYSYEILVTDVEGHRYTAQRSWLEVKESITKEVS